MFLPSKFSSESAQVTVKLDVGTYSFPVSGTGIVSGDFTLTYSMDGAAPVSIAKSGGSVTFPTQTHGSTGKNCVFTFKNTGTGSLGLPCINQFVSISPDYVTEFADTLPFYTAIAVGSTATLTVMALYSAAGTYNDVVTYYTSASSASNTINISVTVN